MTMRTVPFGALAYIALLSGPAWAVNFDICARYAVDFSDADSALGDDYVTDNSDIKAAGVLIRVTDLSTGLLVANEFAADSGTNVGCITASLDPSKQYRLAVISKAVVNGNTITVLDDDTTDNKYAYVVTPWTPLISPTIVTTNIADHWRTMAAATWALRRSNAGLSGETLRFYTQACSGGGSCARLAETGPPIILKAYICPSATCDNTFTKTLIAHEMGHMVARYANGGQKAAADYGYAAPSCIGAAGNSHALNSEEYQGAAAAEGFAHFWAAYAFNDESELDCMFDWYGDWIDWENNDDLTTDPPTDPVLPVFDADQVSCAIYPNPALLTHGIGSGDYASDMCTAGAGLAVEYDWLRMLWDLVSTEGMPVEDVYDIWDAADPQGWLLDGTDAASSMSAGAAAVGWQTEYDAQAAFNGTDR